VADETGIYRFIKAVTPAEKILLQALTQNPNVMGVFSDNGEMVPRGSAEIHSYYMLLKSALGVSPEQIFCRALD
jgi:hypothetical protein